MGKISGDEVKYIAKLAKINLKKSEIGKISKSLTTTIDYVKKLDELDTKDIISTSQVSNLENVFREDEASPSLTQDEALSGIDNAINGYFVTGQVINKNL